MTTRGTFRDRAAGDVMVVFTVSRWHVHRMHLLAVT